MRWPDPRHIIVILGGNEEEERRAVISANSAGYHKTLCARGSLEGDPLDEGEERAPGLRCISRDALALLLSNAIPLANTGDALYNSSSNNNFVLIDVRRKDERILFGSIGGSKHIPVDMLPSALELASEEFEERYRFRKPDRDELIIFSCRTNARATWAAQIATDYGYSNSVIYAQGVNGWKLDPHVQGYPGYAIGSEPPEPFEHETEFIDHAHGMMELQNILLLPTSVK